jgi:hypothetical protein
MTRTTFTIPDDLLTRLKVLAAQRDVSMATIIREALEEKVAEETPALRILGLFDSGYTDTSQLASDWHIYEPRSWR